MTSGFQRNGSGIVWICLGIKPGNSQQASEPSAYSLQQTDDATAGINWRDVDED
jgi:hypothetical protein